MSRGKFGALLVAAIVLTFTITLSPFGIGLYIVMFKKYRSEPDFQSERRALMIIGSLIMCIVVVIVAVILVRLFAAWN